MKELQNLIQETLNDTDVHAEEIPPIDLYIDQIITLMDEKYSSVKRHESDKILTKTMIHNYRKEGLIKPIKGKQYSKEHIVQMLIIYAMKNSLSIQEIKDVFCTIYNDPNFNGESLISGYERSLKVKEKQRKLLPSYLENLFEDENIEVSNSEDLLTLLLNITFMSGYLRRIAEQIIDEYFTIPKNK